MIDRQTQGRLGMDVPPLEKMGVDAKGLKELLGRIGEFADEERRIDLRLRNFDAELEDARDQDARAEADALRSGKEPRGSGGKTIREKEAEREGLERRQKALSLVIDDLVADARAHITENAPEWGRQSEGALQAATERYAQAVDELAAARGDFYGTWSMSQWLEDQNRRYRPRGGDSPVRLGVESGIAATLAQEVMLAPVLAAMRHEAGGPERQKAERERPAMIMKRGHPQVPDTGIREDAG